MTYTCIGCHTTFNKSRSLETHKRTCRSYKTKTGKFRNLIRNLSLSGHREATSESEPAPASVHLEIYEQPEVQVPESPERNNEENLILNELPVTSFLFILIYN